MGGADRDQDPTVNAREWWNALTLTQRVVISFIGAVVALNVALMGVRSAIGGGNPGGPVSSSLSTGGSGLEAFADLARQSGHDVVRLTEAVGQDDLPGGSTVVVADPREMDEAQARAILEAAGRGGRLVLAGPATAPLLAAVAGPELSVEQVGPQNPLAVSVEDAVEGDVGGSVTGRARSMAGDGGTRWQGLEGHRVHVADDDGRPVLVSIPLGRGEVVALADADPLHNRNLAKADNAALALGLAGEPGGVLVFVESVHGFAASGTGAVPAHWRWVAAGLAGAFVVGLWWAGVRFGPPEPDRRALRPPRLDHVRAVAADLDRVAPHPAETVAPLMLANRRHLTEALGIPPDASDTVVAASAEAAGIDPATIATVVEAPADLHTALAVGELAVANRRARTGLDPRRDRQAGTVTRPQPWEASR